LILGPLAVVFLVPSFLIERVAINKDGFSVRTGMWFSPSQHDVQFEKLSAIEISKEEKMGRRGRTKTSFFLLCRDKQGGSEKITIDDFMKEEPLQEMLSAAEKRGVPIVDLQ